MRAARGNLSAAENGERQSRAITDTPSASFAVRCRSNDVFKACRSAGNSFGFLDGRQLYVNQISPKSQRNWNNSNSSGRRPNPFERARITLNRSRSSFNIHKRRCNVLEKKKRLLQPEDNNSRLISAMKEIRNENRRGLNERGRNRIRTYIQHRNKKPFEF